MALTDEYIEENPTVWSEISTGIYKLVYVSPERLLGRESRLWKLIIKDENFRRLIRYIVVDEAHLVVDWGLNFRREYGNIGSLRAYLPGVPVVTVTGTATDAKAKRICEILGVNSSTCTWIKLSTNRPNLFYGVKRITHGNSTTFVNTRTLFYTFVHNINFLSREISNGLYRVRSGDQVTSRAR